MSLRSGASLRLHCIEVAASVNRNGDATAIIQMAEHFYSWVMRESGRLPTTKRLNNISIKDMAKDVMRDADGQGLTVREILCQIQDKWGIELARTSLSPQLSRLVREGKIRNEEGRYVLDQN